jgi:nucleoid-associated protein YgaU
MPLSLTSRYTSLPTYAAPDAKGVSHPTVAIRLVPEPGTPSTPGTPTALIHTVVAGETLETLAFTYLGSSEAWWQIADANPASFPFVPDPGTQIAIPIQANPGQVQRTRPF